jgi:hypothetical protein
MGKLGIDEAGRAIAGLLAPVAAPRPRSLPPLMRQRVNLASRIAATRSADQRRQAAEAYQRGMDDLSRAMADEGATEEYLNFLSSHGVGDDVVERVRSGQLDVSPDARSRRASELGFDAGRTVYRWDDPGKAETLGRARNGLVYTSLTPAMAKEAAQNPYALYPLWGASRVAGIDPAPNPLDVDALMKRLGRLAMSDQHYQWHQFVAGGDRSLANSQRTGVPLPSADSSDAWYSLPAVRFGALERGRQAKSPDLAVSDPEYGRWDTGASMVPDLKEMGYQGMVVSDEAPRSIAYFGSTAERPLPAVRHKDLSALDPEYKYVRNIFASLLAPVAAGAASQYGEE